MSGMLDEVPLLWIGNYPIYQFCGAEDGGSGGDGGGASGTGSGDGAGTGSTDQSGSSDGDGKTGDGKNDGDGDKVDPKLKAANDEAAKRRHEAAAEKKRADAAEARLKSIEDKDKDAKELLERDKKEAEAARDKAIVDNQNLRLQNAFLMDTTHEWLKPLSAWKLLDKDDIKFGDDDKVEGLEDAIKKLAKSDPYLLKPKDSGDDKGKDKGGQQYGASGQSNNGGGGKDGTPSRADMEKKYPALRR